MEKKKRGLTEKQKANLAAGRSKLEANRLAKAARAEINARASAPAPAPAYNLPTPAPQLPQIKKAGGRLWWLVGVSVIAFIIDIFIASLYLSNPTSGILAFFFVLFGGTGFLLCYMGLRKREEGMTLKVKGVKARCPKCNKYYVKNKQHDDCPHADIVPNCLNIYYGYNERKQKYYCDRIAFEEMTADKIVARHPQKCLEDGNFYYVHIYDGKLKKLSAFSDFSEFLDQVYYSPKELPNPLTMPASRELLKPKPTTADKLKPLWWVLAYGIEIFAFIVTAPPPTGG